MVQPSNAGRVVSVVAVSQGLIFVAHPGDTSWTPTTNLTGENPPMNFSGVCFSAANLQKLWLVDGVNMVVLDPRTLTVNLWVASAGQLPIDSRNNTPRLIETWRGRTVLSGLPYDPGNIFMSAVGDPTNYDYSPQSTSPTQAVALQLAPQGVVSDVVTGLFAYSDDVLLVFGDHTVWMMRGDPMSGGQVDQVTNAVGGAWGRPFCKDPYGTVYFFSNRTGIYSLVPGQQPQRISQAIEQLLVNIDTGANSIRLIWDDRAQGLHVFITPLAGPAATFHFFYEQRTSAWWRDQLASPQFDPIAMCTFDGNDANSRVSLIGSYDGVVRSISADATSDDGLPINSQVVIGPLNTSDFSMLLGKDLQGVLGALSGQVNFDVYVGATAEIALSSTPVVSGTFGAGRNLSSLVRYAGHAIYVRLSASNPWSMEAIRVRIQSQGKVQRRGR